MIELRQGSASPDYPTFLHPISSPYPNPISLPLSAVGQRPHISYIYPRLNHPLIQLSPPLISTLTAPSIPSISEACKLAGRGLEKKRGVLSSGGIGRRESLCFASAISRVVSLGPYTHKYSLISLFPPSHLLASRSPKLGPHLFVQ